MTFYIPPFWCGYISGILSLVALLLVLGWAKMRGDKNGT